MLHILLYVVTGILIGVALTRWWSDFKADKITGSVLDHPHAKALAEAVLSVCLWKLRKQDLADAPTEGEWDGQRLPLGSGTTLEGASRTYMTGRNAYAVEQYLARQFGCEEEIDAFVTEVWACLSSGDEETASEDPAPSEAGTELDPPPPGEEPQAIETPPDTVPEDTVHQAMPPSECKTPAYKDNAPTDVHPTDQQ